jgi:hypothetical protein
MAASSSSTSGVSIKPGHSHSPQSKQLTASFTQLSISASSSSAGSEVPSMSAQLATIQTEIIKLQAYLLMGKACEQCKELNDKCKDITTRLLVFVARAAASSVGGEGGPQGGTIGIGNRITLVEPNIFDRIEFGKKGEK